MVNSKRSFRFNKLAGFFPYYQVSSAENVKNYNSCDSSDVEVEHLRVDLVWGFVLFRIDRKRLNFHICFKRVEKGLK